MINAIVAVDERYGIGSNNEMPWPRHKGDMKWFREHTDNGVVLMGRRTWESIGSKPLPNRINAVVTKNELLLARGPAESYASNPITRPHWVMEGDMKDVLWDLEKMYAQKNVWVIGGAEIYRQALPYVDNLYLTTIPGKYDCDVFLNKKQVEAFDHVIFDDTAPDGTRYQIRSRS